MRFRFQKAFVENLNGPYLFDHMYAEDAEGLKFMFVPTVPEMVASYKEKFSAICQQVFDYGLDKFQERDAEVSLFHECVDEAKEENRMLSAAKIEEFLEYKKQVCKNVFEWSHLLVFRSTVRNSLLKQFFNGCGHLWKSNLLI